MSAVDPNPRHVSVMPVEVLTWLDPQPDQTVVDCTAGVGGHSRLIAARGARVVAIDQDAAMIEVARAQTAGLPITFVHAGFDDIAGVLRDLRIGAVDGVLADLGICSDQLDDAARGFSFTRDGPLDMRLDPTVGESAADLLRRLPERDLADLIYEFGEERFSRRIARRIVEARGERPLETTAQLAELVRRCVPKPKGRGGIDPATRTFQALRIAVNDELGALDRLLAGLPSIVKPGGRAVIISFHSLEDRRVKRAFRDGDAWQVLTKKVVTAGDDEVQTNPRARSAKLRAAQRIGEPHA
ncbi:MAG: 16S rRNA (cytosine(1402)-N(4))-methyltransferase RsmH [Gemmataceae bacterium]